MVSRFGQESTAVRILIAESRHGVRSALRLLLEQDEVMVVSGEAIGIEELLDKARWTCPNVILLDCDLPGLEAGELLPILHSICPNAHVIVLCSRPEMQQPALSAGADAFVSKADPPEKLLSVIRSNFTFRMSKPADQNSGYNSDPQGKSSGKRQEFHRGVKLNNTSMGQLTATNRVSNKSASHSWEVKYLPDKATVAVSASGQLSLQDAKEMIEKSIHLLRENKAHRVIADLSNAHFKVAVADIYYTPEYYDKLGMPRNARIALILPKTQERLSTLYEFHETVCHNKGYLCKLFDSQQSAHEWLGLGS